jgi:hypothetical protein
MKMKKNTSDTDRLIRVLIAMVFIAMNVGGLISLPVSILVWIVTVILITTALIGNCPLYSLFGINTHSKKKEVSKYH